MALNSTIYVFTVRLADADRNIYETLTLRMARHPSETEDYLVTRLLAYCVEYTEGVGFSNGLSSPDEPAIEIRDLTGVLQSWIDVGTPEPSRLHKAAKAARRVAVYVHRNFETWFQRLRGERIHRSQELEIYVVPPELLSEVVKRLERRLDFDLAISDGTLYLSVGEDTLTGSFERRRLDSLD